jgi:internalin-related protein
MSIRYLACASLVLMLTSCLKDPDILFPKDLRPNIELTLASSQKDVTLTLTSDKAESVFIDLNGNAQKDEGESFEVGKPVTIHPKGDKLGLYGPFTSLDISGQDVTRISGKGLIDLEAMNLTNTKLSAMEIEVALRLVAGKEGGKLTLEEWRVTSSIREFIKFFKWQIVRPNGSLIDPNESVLMLRALAKEVQEKRVALELEGGKGLWLDKNLNGTKDADENLPTGALTLNLPASLPTGESVYIIHGSATGLSLNVAEDPAEDESEEPEDSDEGADEAENTRALRANEDGSQIGISIDASRFSSLLSMECERGLNVKYVDVSGCKSLATLTLDGNPIETLVLPDSGSELKVLQLAGNRLETLDISDLTKLSQFTASNGTLDYIYSIPSELITLNLSGNKLTDLIIPRDSKLKTLNLKNNMLRNLKIKGEAYNGLETCNLEGNQLESLDLAAFVKTKLINVSNNPLKSIELPWDMKELNISKTELQSLNLNPKDTAHKSFIQKLDASNCAKLTLIQMSQCTNLSSVNLQGSKALKGDKISSELPQLTGHKGKLTIEQGRLSASELSAIKAKGWSL